MGENNQIFPACAVRGATASARKHGSMPSWAILRIQSNICRCPPPERWRSPCQTDLLFRL